MFGRPFNLSVLSKLLRLLLVPLLLVAAGAGWYLLTTPGIKPVVINVNQPPTLMVEPVNPVQLGKVPTDSQVNTEVFLYNLGGHPLIIKEVSASCGCTVAKPDKTYIEPGDLARLSITLDTSIKLGHVEKTVTIVSNDPVRPVVTVQLKGQVMAIVMGHEKIAVKDPTVLFKGKCAECHVKKGIGKSGAALFRADCAMCHGDSAQGHVAKALVPGPYHSLEFRKHIRQIIANGSPHTPEMSPFSQKNGGPLSEGQIDSLVQYLGYLSKKMQSENAHSEASSR
ncbi:MAG: DUF1573 domain-containing protein [Cyanobacteria bacterium]|nr:DUF1573 domain-containing protein [Cyanobacteriota bacterium]